MHQYSARQVLAAASEVPFFRPENDKPSNPITGLLNKFGHLSLMLTVFAASSVICISSKPAIAASHHGILKEQSKASSAASKPARNIKLGTNSQLRVHSGPAGNAAHRSTSARNVSASRHASPTRLVAGKRKHGETRNADAIHRDAVPLANTTWDNPEVPPAVLDAIQSAARESGVDPHLLAAIAWRESRFDPNARSQQSSAKGLLQFTTGTWLQMVRDYGSQHNVADYAAAIHTTRSGDLVVSGQQTRDDILQLRNDPILSAKLAAENMIRQRALLQTQLKRRMRPADLYLIHVLGPTGATRFLTAVAKHPTASSLDVASLTVMRNAGLLARDGKPLTVANTYAATQKMLKAQRTHSAPMLAAAKSIDNTSPVMPIQVSEAP